MPNTVRLYQKDVYRTHSPGTIVACQPWEGGLDVALDQTVFFPEGGGQSSDLGTLTLMLPAAQNPKWETTENPPAWPISWAYEQDGFVFHRIALAKTEGNLDSPEEKSKPSPAFLQVGDAVEVSIHWPHRFENMQRHLGEHIVSGVLYRHFGYGNQGFHMGQDYMTIDVVPLPPQSKDWLSPEDLAQVEWLANQVIWQDLPVWVSYFATQAEASHMPTRKAVTFAEDISIVSVGPQDHLDALADCVACCGTHPSSTGQVGIIKIYKSEKNKGMQRIYLDAGSKALAEMAKDYALLMQIANAHTTSPSELPQRLEAEKRRGKEVREELSALRDHLLTSLFTEALTKASPSGCPLLTVDLLSVRDVNTLGKKLKKNLKGALCFYVVKDHTLLLFSSGDFHCGDFVKTHGLPLGGKGGGGRDFAQVVLPGAKEAEALCQHLPSPALD